MHAGVKFIVAGCLVASVASAGAQSSGGAAAVSQLDVVSVESQTGGRESTQGSVVTSRHHAGTYVRVTTVERGYGHAMATMNNGAVRETQTVNLCDGGRGTMVPCRNGQTVVGHMRTWDVTGKGNGQFVVKSTSVNWPRNTLTKALSIH